MHSLAPISSSVLYPRSHGSHSLAPVLPSVLCPAAQSVHEVAASSPVYLPSAQSSQSPEPAAAANVPGAHALHSVAPVLPSVVFPGVQFSHEAAPSLALYVPSAQAVHSGIPAFAAYLPASHSSQVTEPSENQPASPPVEVLPGAQSAHELCPSFPFVVFPAAQS